MKPASDGQLWARAELQSTLDRAGTQSTIMTTCNWLRVENFKVKWVKKETNWGISNYDAIECWGLYHASYHSIKFHLPKQNQSHKTKTRPDWREDIKFSIHMMLFTFQDEACSLINNSLLYCIKCIYQKR